MEHVEFNPVTDSCVVRHDNFDRKEVFEEAFDEVIKNDFRDLVFICKDEHVSYHSEIVASISPVIRAFVQKSKSCECSSFIKSQVELFVTLAGVHSDVLEMVMSCVYGKQPMRFSKTNLSEVSAIFKMLGVNRKSFNIENMSKFDLEATYHKPVNTFKRKVFSEHDSVQKRVKSSEEYEKMNQANYDEEIKKPVDRRAETIFKEHKSITMTKVEMKPESNLERFTPNPPPISQIPTNASISPNSDTPAENKIQMFLPHLTVTSVKQDHLENRKVDETNSEADDAMEGQEHAFQDTVREEFGPNIPLAETDLSDSQNDLKCPLAYCTTGKTFRVRCEILLHLAHVHYTDQLLDLYPYTRGGPCQLCLDQQREKVYSTSTKKAFVMHVGVTHEVVLNLLPQELKDVLSAMGKSKKSRKSKKKNAQESDLMSRSFMDSGDVSFSNNSFSNSFNEPNESDPVYDNYNQNYEEGSANFEDPYQEAPKSYEDPYNKAPQSYEAPYHKPHESYEDPYQEAPEMYENQYQVAPENFENEANEPYDGVVSNSSEAFQDENMYPEDNKYQESDIPLGQSEAYNQTPSEGQEGGFFTSSELENPEASQSGKGPTVKDDNHLTCHLCTMRSFPKKDDLLFHLTFSHFSKDLLQIHPYIENKECDLCPNDPNISTSMSSHLRHLGVAHREVIQFVTPDIAEQLRLEDPRTETSTEIDATKVEEEAKEIKQEVSRNVTVAPQETTSVQCSLCPNKVRIYSKRSDFLKHLSLGHYGRNILQINPFQEGQNCTVCQETSSKVFVPTKKEIHVCHLGVLHGKVFDYISEDLLEMVRSLPTLKKAALVKPEQKIDSLAESKLDVPTKEETTNENSTPADPALQEEAADPTLQEEVAK